MYDSLLNFMNQIDADGIDFVELNFPTNDKIIASYTKEEFAKDGLIYKTNRLYWRMINGVKNYYCGENKSGYVIWKDLEQLKEETMTACYRFGGYKNEENIQSYFDTKF